MRDLKGFARAQSIFIELVVKDVNLSSVPVNPGPSDKSPPESALIPPLGLKVADQRVSGDFEVGYVGESKPIVMLYVSDLTFKRIYSYANVIFIIMFLLGGHF